MPIATGVGIDPVHVGLLIVLNLAIGALTPPVGGRMYISCSILEVRAVDYLRSILPLLAAELAVLLLLTCAPVPVTFLPNLLMGPGR